MSSCVPTVDCYPAEKLADSLRNSSIPVYLHFTLLLYVHIYIFFHFIDVIYGTFVAEKLGNS